MDRAGARVGGDVGSQHAENRTIQKRMLESDAVKDGSLEARKFFRRSELAGSGHLLGQRSGDDVDLTSTPTSSATYSKSG